MKKIIYLGDLNSPHFAKFTKYFADKCQLTVISAARPGAYSRERHGNIEVNYLNRYTGTKFDYLINLSLVKKIINSLQPDLIHAHYATSYGLLAAINSSRIPLIISTWGSDIIEFANISFIHRALISKVLSGATKIMATSKFLKKKTSELITCDHKPYIYVTPFGIDTSIFNGDENHLMSKNIEGKTINFFYAKSLEKYYNHLFVFEAIATMKKNFPNVNIKLTLAGEGSLKPQFEDAIANLGIQENVEFKGLASQNEVVEILKNTDLVLMPSISESYGVFALEAQAMGVPVVVSDAGGLPEVVLEGKTGFIIPLKEKGRFFDVLACLIKNRELRLKMGINGIRFVKNNFSVEKCMKIVDEIYGTLLKPL